MIMIERPGLPEITPVGAVRFLLVVHLAVVLGVGTWVWLVSLALAAMAGSDTSGIGPSIILWLLLIGVTPVVNLLAAVHLKARPNRARRYLMVAATWAWLQVIGAALIGIALVFWIPVLLLLIVPAVLMALGITRAAVRETPPQQAEHATWRTAVIDVGIGVGISAGVLALPVTYLQ
jgi:hypothetical protein